MKNRFSHRKKEEKLFNPLVKCEKESVDVRLL